MISSLAKLMLRVTALLIMLSCAPCMASQLSWKDTTDWLQSVVPEETRFTFQQTRIKFNGCKQREYQLLASQPINHYLTIEGSLGYGKGRMRFGIHQQKVSSKEVSLMPVVTVSHNVTMGLGVTLQSQPEFRSSTGVNLDLPGSRTLALSTRFHSNDGQHLFAVELRQQQWFGAQSDIQWEHAGQRDNSIQLNYSALF